jgi:hypothetical protein
MLSIFHGPSVYIYKDIKTKDKKMEINRKKIGFSVGVLLFLYWLLKHTRVRHFLAPILNSLLFSHSICLNFTIL